jgi:hypothetical protein
MLKLNFLKKLSAKNISFQLTFHKCQLKKLLIQNNST